MNDAARAVPAHRRWAVGLLIAALLVNVLSGNSHLLGFPIPPDRVLLAASLVLLARDGGWATLAQTRWRSVHVLGLATVAWTAGSALAHDTLLTSYGFYALLDRLVVPLLLYLIAPLVFRDEWSREWLLKALVVLGLYLGITGVFEMARLDALVFPRYIMDESVGILFGRARGPFAQAEANAMVLAACLFASTGAAVRFRGRWRAVAVSGMFACAVGVLLTLTRSVWLGVALVLVVAMAVPSPLQRRVLAGAAGCLALLGASLVAFPAFRTLLLDRLTTQRSVHDRQNTNAAALQVIREHPIDGLGWMRYVEESVLWVRQADLYPVTNVTIEVHNVVLARAAELGLVGAALWVALLLAGPGMAVLTRVPDDLKLWQYILIGYAAVYAVCSMVSPVPYPLAGNLLWLFAGIVSMGGVQVRALRPPASSPAPRPRHG